MSHTPHKHHATRDHRFAYISKGNIATWAKATTGFRYPEPKNDRRQRRGPAIVDEPVHGQPIPASMPERPCVIAPKENEKDCRGEIASLERKSSAVFRGLDISNEINRRFGLHAKAKMRIL